MNSSTHRAQRYELSPAWYFMCLCMSFQEIKHLPHRAHWYEFFTGWHLTCFFMWWLNSKQLSHRAQCYVISLAWLFMCIVWWFLMLLLNISSTRNHLFLQSAFNRAKSCWVLLALPLPIPSTRNHLVLLQGVFNTSLFSIQQAASLSLTILYRSFWSWRLTLLPFH